MTRRLAHILVAASLLATPAAAQTCVGDAFDRPFPGATQVVMRHADVPSAQYPGFWQEGLIDGDFYQIFANKVAVVQARRSDPAWSVTVACQQRPCIQSVTGNPPDRAKKVSKALEQCLLPPEVKVADAKTAPKAAVAGQKPEEPKKGQTKSPEPVKPVKPKEPATEIPEKPKVQAPPKPNSAQPAKAPVKPTTTAAPAKPVTNTAPAKSEADVQVQPKVGAKSGEFVAVSDVGGGVAATETTGAGRAKPAAVRTDNIAAAGKPGPNAGNSDVEVVCTPVPQKSKGLRAPACGLTIIPEGTPVTTLQRLLVLAGADPGPIDGAFGRKTEDAILLVLGLAGSELEIPEAITAVDAYLCRRGQ